MSDHLTKALAQSIVSITHADKALREGHDLSEKERAEFGAAQRLYFRMYLDALIGIIQRERFIGNQAIEPLLILSDNIAGLDGPGETPELFKAVPKDLGHSKSLNRITAEGQAVGCVIYLIEAVGDKPMFACEAIASMFGHIGHRPRVKDSLHSAEKLPKLSAKTVYGWYAELGCSRTLEDGADKLRQAAKVGSLEALEQAERDEPILHLQGPDFRIQLAQRIMAIAAKTLIGSADGPGWRRVLSENSE